MARTGINLLPPVITNAQAVELYRNLAKTNLLIGQLKSEFDHSLVNNSLISMFSLKESVQSTRIEGTQVTFSDMIERKKADGDNWEQREVLNYQQALHTGADMLKHGEPISTRMIKSLHKILMYNARGTNAAGGEFRKIQNFIGPDRKIENAVYIPISAAEIDRYMENLEFFINNTPHSSFRKYNTTDGYVLDETCDPIIKLAIMHAQFESIHPFLDGNGRMGRILIALLALKTGLVNAPVFLVSEELEKERARYYDLLNGVRGDNPEWYPWLKFFIQACTRMTENLLAKINAATKLADDGLAKCRLVSEQRLWIYSFSEPITTASKAAKALGISSTTARAGLTQLAINELLYADESVKRNRRYHNYELLRILS